MVSKMSPVPLCTLIRCLALLCWSQRWSSATGTTQLQTASLLCSKSGQQALYPSTKSKHLLSKPLSLLLLFIPSPCSSCSLIALTLSCSSSNLSPSMPTFQSPVDSDNESIWFCFPALVFSASGTPLCCFATGGFKSSSAACRHRRSYPLGRNKSGSL